MKYNLLSGPHHGVEVDFEVGDYGIPLMEVFNAVEQPKYGQISPSPEVPMHPANMKIHRYHRKVMMRNGTPFCVGFIHQEDAE